MLITGIIHLHVEINIGSKNLRNIGSKSKYVIHWLLNVLSALLQHQTWCHRSSSLPTLNVTIYLFPSSSVFVECPSCYWHQPFNCHHQSKTEEIHVESFCRRWQSLYLPLPLSMQWMPQTSPVIKPSLSVNRYCTICGFGCKHRLIADPWLFAIK